MKKKIQYIKIELPKKDEMLFITLPGIEGGLLNDFNKLLTQAKEKAEREGKGFIMVTNFPEVTITRIPTHKLVARSL